MIFLGDFLATQTVSARFFTEDPTGAPITLAGVPAARVRKGSGAGTTITAGVTLTVDVVTGQHVVDVDLTASPSYTAGAEYTIELSAGTVNGVSVVGKTIASFSIGNRTVSTVGSVTGAVGSVTADVGITQAGADKVWASAARTLTSFGTLVADAATAVWAAAVRTLTAFAFTPSLDPAYDAAKTAATQASVDDLPTNAELATALAAADDATLAAIAALDIPSLSAIAAQIISDHGAGSYVRNTEPSTPPAAVDVADAVLGRNLAGGSNGGRTVRDALRVLRNKVVIVPVNATTGTINVYDEADTAIVWSGTVTRADVDAPVGVDPS